MSLERDHHLYYSYDIRSAMLSTLNLLMITIEYRQLIFQRTTLESPCGRLLDRVAYRVYTRRLRVERESAHTHTRRAGPGERLSFTHLHRSARPRPRRSVFEPPPCVCSLLSVVCDALWGEHAPVPTLSFS